MHLNFIRIALLIVFLNSFLTACKKDKESGPQTPQLNCLVTKMEANNGYSSTYQYNASGQLKAIHFYQTQVGEPSPILLKTVTLERDSQNRIIKTVGVRSDGSGDSTILEYDTKGRLIKSSFTNLPNHITGNYSTLAEYDSQGLIIKTTTTYTYRDSADYVEIYTYEYLNGNLSKETTPDGYIHYFEYYNDKENKNLELEPLNYISGIQWHSPPKNLLKKATYIQDNIYEYSYEFDTKGFVSKTIIDYPNSSLGNQSINIYTYSCN